MLARVASTSSRLLSTSLSNAQKRLPVLTLYTGGPECSLCEVAKADLAHVNQVEPFLLDTWNIREPPKGATVEEIKKWKRAYQYDIPVLHMEGRMLQKHRIDKDKLIAAIRVWHEEQSKAGDPGAT